MNRAPERRLSRPRRTHCKCDAYCCMHLVRERLGEVLCLTIKTNHAGGRPKTKHRYLRACTSQWPTPNAPLRACQWLRPGHWQAVPLAVGCGILARGCASGVGHPGQGYGGLPVGCPPIPRQAPWPGFFNVAGRLWQAANVPPSGRRRAAVAGSLPVAHSVGASQAGRDPGPRARKRRLERVLPVRRGRPR